MDGCRTSSGRVVFAVDDVVPASERLPERRTHEAVRAIIAGKERLLSCSDYHGTIVEGPSGHGLLAAVHLAYADHRPLVLSPDIVWLTSAQGLARHVENHGEELRGRLVRHEGRLVLVVERREWALDSPEYPWPDAFAEFAERIREHARPEAYALVVCDFSTTGAVERAASQVVLMETFRQYFDYVMTFICGIRRSRSRARPPTGRRSGVAWTVSRSSGWTGGSTGSVRSRTSSWPRARVGWTERS